MKQHYEWLTNIGILDFKDKTALIVGGREMGMQYALALSKMNVKDITIITKSEKIPSEFCKSLGINALTGGFEEHLPNMGKKDLTIVATPIPLLLDATTRAIECGQNNILVEKPGSLYSNKLLDLAKKVGSKKVRIAYNRLVYPSFHKLMSMVDKGEDISSCRFCFTEWIHRIPFEKYQTDEYHRWGIANSLHVISMAMELIGMPKEITLYQLGKLDWHPSGSVFVGSGISRNDIPFSYHADWGGGGRWELEIITKKNAYRLIPLEEIHSCPTGSVTWKKESLETAYTDVKPGIAEEVAVMLDDNIEEKIGLISLEKAAELNKLAEKIFGYERQ